MLLSKQKKPYYTIIQKAAEGCGLKLVGRETIAAFGSHTFTKVMAKCLCVQALKQQNIGIARSTSLLQKHERSTWF